MKRLVLFFLLVAVALLAPRAAESVDLKLATILPVGTSGHQSLMEMRDAFHQAARGALKVTVYAGSADGEMLLVKKMRARQIHAALISAVGLAQIDRSVTCLQLMPLAFHDWREVDYVRQKIAAGLESRLRAKGFEVLFWADAGWVRYFSKAPAVHPADLKPMKMWVWSGEPQQLTLLRDMGYQPVSLETEQILPALSTGMIEVVPVPPFLANALQYNRYAGHMIDMNWVPMVGAAIVRRDTWEKLAPELRQELLKISARTGEKMRLRAREEDEEAIAAMQKRGLVVHKLTPEIATAWRTLAESAYPRIRGAMVPPDLFDSVLAHVAAFRAQNGAASR
jgi:TRAP-type C4-dicarboxylate transport system substrate-binding protein